jgi:(p)ppGpp synthase/HD superfamily hydrolase
MTTIEEAMAYVKMGVSVIPITYRSKAPAIRWSEFMKRLPTEQEIREWFKNEKMNIGIVCGKVSGNLLVFDFDDQEAMSFVIEDINEVAKKTLVVRTGKGFHIYYRVKTPENFKLMNMKVDVKGGEVMLLAPRLYIHLGSDTRLLAQ